MKRLATVLLTGAMALTISPSPLLAQDYPTKAINMIVSSATGGPIDFAARAIKDGLEAELGKPIIIENRPGAGGMTATAAAGRAAPDGYTLLMSGAGPMVITPMLYDKVPYNTLKDFIPVSQVLDLPCYIAVTPSLKASTIQELAALAKSAGAKKLTYSTSGPGTPGHLAMVMFETMFGVELEQIPYKGAPEAANSTATGETDIIFTTAIVSTPLIEAGKLKPLVITSRERLRPNVPTIFDIGYPQLTAPLAVGLWAPANTPKPIVEKLDRAVQKVLADPKVKAVIEKSMAIAAINGSDGYAKLVKSEFDAWSKITKDRNIKIEQ